jgi:predicted RNA binding protein YcfA (HicA-like mRNA interferase family)
MKWNELKRKLTKAGWQMLRQGKGSHEIWSNPSIENSEIVMTSHGAQEVASGLASKILKKAGLK